MWDRRVLVVHPPVSIARDFIDYPYFADLGAVQLAAVLRPRGPTSLVDAYALHGSTLAWMPDGRARLGASPREVLDACVEVGPVGAVVVAITPFHRPPRRAPLLGAVLEGLRAWDVDVPILLADLYQSGQHYVAAPPEALLEAYPEVDAWVQFEAERTVPELLAAWFEGGERPRGAYRGEAPADLDALPPPAWDLVDLDALDRFRERVVALLGRGAWSFPIDGRTLPLLTSRGCPFRCIHCSSNPDRAPSEPKTQRRHSAEVLGRRIDALVREHGATRLAVLDELVNVNERHFDAFLDHVTRQGVAFEIPNGMRADYLERRHLELMRGRVTSVSVSAESGAQEVVAHIVDKRLDLSRIEAAARAAHEVGIPMLIHYMIGLPGERAAQINRTLAFAIDQWERYGAWPAVQFATPLPGTALADEVTRRGVRLPVVEDWGPFFQTGASATAAAVTNEQLERFMRAFERRRDASRAPAEVTVAITHRCNSNCSFCGLGPRVEQVDLGLESSSAIDAARRSGAEVLWLDGGEPTLHPGLLELVSAGRAAGFAEVGLWTNARRLAYPHYTEALVRAGLSRLRVSIHGPTASIHDRVVGESGAFTQGMAGLKNALRHDALEVTVRMTLCRLNQGLQAEVAEMVHALGLARLEIGYPIPIGPASRAAAPDLDIALEATRAAIDAWGDRLEIRVFDLPACRLPGHELRIADDTAVLAGRRHRVEAPGVGWAAWVAARRRPDARCEECVHAVTCSGFVHRELDGAPHWLVSVRVGASPTRS